MNDAYPHGVFPQDWSPKRRLSSDLISLRMEYRGASLPEVYRDLGLMIDWRWRDRNC